MTATLTFTVSLDAVSAGAVTVGYALDSADAGTATAGSDYAALTGSVLTIAAGETGGAISVSITGDDRDEPDETVRVRLAEPTGGVLSATAALGVGTIRDDDEAPTVTLTLADRSISEDGGATTVSATLSHPSSAATTITVSESAGAYAVGEDATITIPAGETGSAADTATLTAVDNATDAPGRSVTVTGSASNAQGVGAVTGAGLTLEDDDEAPTVTLTLADRSISEDGGATTVSATLSHPSSAATTITVSESAGAYAVGEDATITIGAGETGNAADSVTLTAVDNATDAPDRSVTVAGSASNAQGVGAVAGAGLTLEDDDEAPTVTLALADDSIPEDGGSTTVSATLSHPSSASTTITVSAATGEYAVGDDATITIAAGETANAADTATVTAVADPESDGDRRVTVSASASNAQGIGAVTGAALTLEADAGGLGPSGAADEAPTLSLDSPRISEGAAGTTTTLTFTVSLSATATDTVTVGFATDAGNPGTATAGTDYAALASGTLTFAAGDTSRTISVSVTGDATDEPDETVRVTLSGPTNAVLSATAATGVGTIADDDEAPTVTLTVADDSISEDGGSTTVSATLSHPSSAATTITVAPVVGEYTAADDTITIAAGETANAADTATITAVADPESDSDRSVTVTATASNPQGIGAVNGASLTLEAASDAGGSGPSGSQDGGVTVSMDSPRVSEGAAGTTTTLTFTVSLSATATDTVTVGFATDSGNPGTATAGTDYTALAPGTLTFAAGDTSRTISVSVTGDATDEPDETVRVTLSSPTNAVLSAAAATGVGTIADDDEAPTVTLTVADASIPEDGGSTTVSATLSHPSSAATRITVAPVLGEYTAEDDTLTIPAGETANGADTATITAMADPESAGDRRVTVTATASNAQGIGAVTGASLTLEAAPETGGSGPSGAQDGGITVSMDSPRVAEGAAGTTGTLTFTVSLSAAATETVTVGFGTDGGNAGTATAGTDYTALASGTLTFAAGDTSRTISVSVTGDDTDEPDETVRVTLNSPTNAVLSATAATGTGTITDDDAAPTVTLSPASDSISENGGSTTVSATLSHPSSAATTITITAAAGSYTVDADATITIGAGNTVNGSDTARIVAVDNGTDESNRRVTVTGTAINAQGVGTVTGAALTLVDDDGDPSLTIGSPTVTEGDTGTAALHYRVALSPTGASEVTVNYAEGTGGTAASGADYLALSPGTLTFAPGESSKTITVSVVADTTDEENETLPVTLSGASGAAIATATGTGTITDDDPAPTVSIGSVSGSEGDSGSSALDLTVSLSAASGKQVTVDYAEGTGGTATAPADYTALTAGTVTFAAGETTGTVSLSVAGDTTDEPDETVVVGLSDATNAAIGTASGTATITDDDDAPTVTLSVADSTIAENGGSTTVIATLSHASSEATTITVSAVSGIYTVGADTTITIAAGDTANSADTVTITAVDNTLNDGTRRVTVRGSAANSLAIGAVRGATLFLDDDEPGVSSSCTVDGVRVSMTVSASLVAEDSGVSYITTRILDATGNGLLVMLDITGGVLDSDYRLRGAGETAFGATRRLRFPAGSAANTDHTTSLTARPDTSLGNRTLTISARVLGDGENVCSLPARRVTIVDDDGSLVVGPVTGQATEAGGQSTFTVRLARRPSANVTMTVSSLDSGEGTAAPTSLTFAPGAWNTPRTVTVTGADDTVHDGAQTWSVRLGAPTTTDPDYSGMGHQDVTVTTTDDENTPTVTIALSASSISENGGETKISATLNAASGADTTLRFFPPTGGHLAVPDDTIVIPAGSTANAEDTATLRAVDNDADTHDRPFTIRIGRLTNPYGVNIAGSVGLTVTDDDPAPTVTVSASPAVVSENGGTSTLTATLSRPSSARTNLTFSPSSGNYTLGTDTTISIPPWTTSNATDTVTVTAVNNATDEADRRLTVTPAATNTQGLGTITGAALTLTDDDGPPTVTLRVSPTSVPEAGGTASVSATLGHSWSQNVRVVVNGVAGVYNAGTNHIIIPPGSTTSSTTVGITAVDNDWYGGDRRVTVTASAWASRPGRRPSQRVFVNGAALTLVDDDPSALPVVSINSPRATERSVSQNQYFQIPFRVTLTRSPGRRASVDLTVTGGTASDPSDFRAGNGGHFARVDRNGRAALGATVVFWPGERSKIVNLAARSDGDSESDETVVVTLSNPVNLTLGTAVGTATISDSPLAPYFSISSPSVTEGDSGNAALTFSVETDVPSSAIVSVAYADAGTGTATSGTDYTALTAGTVSMPPGQQSRDVEIRIVGDTVDEVDETIVVTLTNPGGGAAFAAGATSVSGTGTIRDDDDGPSLSIGSATVAEGDSGTASLTFAVTLSPASAKQVTVDYADAGTGSASSGTDYTAIGDGTLTFAAGDTRKTITVSVTGDEIDEANETVEVELSGAANATIGTAKGTGTITDDDGGPSLSIDAPTVDEGDAGTANLTWTVRLNAASEQEVTVNYAEKTGGTATAGTDYTALTGGTLTFAAGDTAKTITVSVNGDETDEANETVLVELSSAGNATIGTATGTGTITDDDDAPTVTLALSRSSLTESGTRNSSTVTATQDGLSSRDTTITVSAAPGTGTASSDYSLSGNRTLTIAAGTTTSTGTVTITAVDNINDSPTRSVTVSGSAANSVGVTDPEAVSLTITDDDGEPSVSIGSASVSEGDSGASDLELLVTLSPASGKRVTVDYEDAGTGTATSGTDYAAIPDGTLTFDPGVSRLAIPVSVTGDTTDEANETVVVGVTRANGATISATAGAGTGTITDDDEAPTVTLSLSPASISESGATNAATVTASLDRASSAVTRVTVDAAAGTNAEAADFSLSSNKTLWIAAGATRSAGRVTVTAVDNETDEPDRSVTVSGSARNSRGVTGPSDLTLTITDDDDEPSLAIGSARVTEGDSGSRDLTFTVRLSAVSGKEVTVGYADAGSGTATSGTDYTAITAGTLTFAAGDTSKTITVSVTGDTTDEPHETVRVTLSGAGNATIGTATGTGTIRDDDDEPSLAIGSASVTEGDSGSAALTFTVTLSAASGKEVTVGYADAGTGSATSGTDYTALPSGTLTFAAGDLSKTIPVSVTGDTTDEPNETVEVTLSGASNATISTATGTGTITDDDDAPTVTLSLSPTSIAESGASNSSTVTASLDHPSSAVTRITVDAAAGTNAASGDFSLSSNKVLTVAAGTTTSTGTVTITAVDDSRDGPDKSVTVSGSARNTRGITNPSEVTLTITDDDDEPSLSLDSPSATEGDSGSTTLTFTVTLSAASDRQVTVGYADAGTGTATSGTDYTAITTGTLTFAAGDTSKTITVSVTGDTTDEPNETVAVTLSGATNATISTATGTGTITDDDDAPEVTLSLSPSSIAESGSSNASTVTASLGHPSSAVTTITVDAVAGTNAGSGDFSLSSNKVLTIAAGDTSSSGTVTITAVDDSRDGPDKSVTVSGSATNSQGITNPSDLTLTITDDDGEPSLSIDSPSAAEGDSGSATLTFTVTLSAASDRQITVDYADAGTGTATSGTDYTAVPTGTLTFAAGDTSKTIAVSVTGDTTDEPNETMAVTLSGATNATISTATGTGTITDDDDAPEVTLSLSPSSIAESGSSNSSTVTASLDHPSSAVTTITVAAAAGTNAVSGDFSLSSNKVLTIAAGDTSSTGTVTITAVDDSRDGPDKSVTVSGSATNTQGITNPSDLTLTITDDDGEPSLSIDSPSVTEGDSGSATLTFTVTLSGASDRQITVAYADAGTGTATSGTDYTAIPTGTLTFAAGDTSKTIAVFVTGDTTDEPNETVEVTLSGATNATISTATGTGTITDDDDAPTVTLSLSRISIAESGASNASTVTASLDHPSSAVTTISVDAAAGTNAASGDFSLSANKTLTIAAGDTTSTGTVTVTAVDNDKDGPEKSVTVSGTATNTQGITNPSDLTLTITDDDGEPSLSIDSPSAAEGDSGSATLTFTVTLSGASDRQITVGYADAGTGTATSGTDYTAITTGTLTFAAGDTSKTIAVSVTGDTTDEPNETVAVTLSGASNATISTATGTGTITDDDDAPEVTLSLSPTSIAESGSSNASTVTASLDHASSAATTITVAAAAGTNAVSGDFSLSSNKVLTIAAGDTTSTGTVTVTAVDDSRDGPDKSVTVSGSATNSQGITNPSDVTLTITDDDGEPSLSIDSPSVTEGDSGSATLTFTVTLSGASDRQITVAYADAGTGTATSGTDYTAIPTGTLTFAAGDTSKTIAVSVTGDTTDEPNETVAVTLSGASNATISTATGTGTITDDDDAPEVTLSLSPTSIAESGTSNASTVTASLDHPSSAATTITVDAAAGTNAVSGDFSLSSNKVLTIAAGDTSSTGTVTITAVDDSRDGPDKSVTVSGTATNTQGITNPSDRTLTITDDDGEPSLSIDSPSGAEGDSGSATLTFTVTLSGASDRQITVGYADAGTGTATSGTDYTAVSTGTLTFAAGDTSKTIAVSVTGDTTDEPNETVEVTLSGASNATISTATGTGTITDDDDAPEVTMSLSPASIAESGVSNSSTVTASLDHPSSAVTTITVAAAAGTNAVSGDFSLSSNKVLTIAAGDTSSTGTVTITAVDDSRDGPDKSVTVSGTATNTQGITNPSDLTLTITDDDGEPSLSIDSPSAAEGDSGSATLTFTVTLSGASDRQITVGYADAGTGTATSGTDYTAITTGTLTFAAGDTSKTIAVSVTGDTTDEPNETVAVTLSGASNAAIGTATGTGTITDDDDAPEVTLSLSPTSIAESGTSNFSTVTASLDHPSSAATTITVDAVAGTNAVSGDFSLSSNKVLTIAAGDTSSSGTVTITAVDDSRDGPDKSVMVSGTATNTQGITNPSDLTLTITDDDGEPSLSIDSPSAAEGDSGSATLTFTVTLSGASDRQITVGYADAGTGTATSGTDYTALPTGTLTLAAGETSKTIAVSVTGDTTDEPNETVAVTLSGATNATISTATGTGTITDDDDAPTVTLSLSRTSIAESGSSNSSTVTASLDHPSSAATTITVDAAAGTNAVSGDFSISANKTLTIAAGDTSSTGTVTITAVDDSRDGPDKSVTVSGTATNSQGITNPSDLTLTITDDDGEPSLSIDSPSAAEGDSGSATLTFTATLSAASDRQITVGYADAATGTATSGTDYTAIPTGTLTFAAGDTSKTIAVSVTGDTTDEPNETVEVTLSGASNATISTATGTGTITDDDDAPTVTLSLSRTSIAESGASNSSTVTASLDHPSSAVTTITVAAAAGTNAVSGDFSLSANKVLTIAAGDTSSTGTVTITAVDDSRDGPDKSVTVSGSATNTQGITNPSDLTLTITDDDGEPSLSIDSPSAAEGDSGSATLTFTVTLSGASDRQITVGYADAATGTATSGTDYTALDDGTLTFAAGDTSKTIAVSVTGDTTDEPNETVAVTLSGASNAAIGTATGTGTITDDDDAPEVTLSLSPTSIAESGASNASTVTASLDHPSSAVTTITVAVAAGTNAASGDFSVSANKTLTIAAGDTSSTGTVTITAVDDSRDGPDKSVTVSGSATNTQGITNPSDRTLTITDDDGEPSLSIDSPSATEGDSGSATLTFTVTLSGASDRQITVGYADAGTGTATSGTDYTAITTGTLTFAAGDTSKTITVSVTGDTTDEPNETVAVTLSGASNAAISTATGTGTITDDDDAPEVTLSLSPTSIAESGASNSSTVTASLDHPSSAVTTITVAAAAGTNAVSGDFSLSSNKVLTIAAGDTSSTGTVTITAVDDSRDGPDKSVTVSGTATNTQGITNPSDLTLTITDDDGEPSLSIDSPSVTEGDSGSATLTFTVTLSGASDRQITVGYADAGTGTATSGTDYTAIPTGTLTFAAGDTSKTITVSVTGDTTDEPNETVAVTLSGASNATISRATGTGTITDDDDAPEVTLSLSPTSIAESGASNSSTVTASLDHPSSAATTITVDAAAGTNAVSGDFSLSSNKTLTIAAGTTTSTGAVRITAVDNSTDEPDKSVTVSGSATNSRGITNPSNVTLTITDDDGEPSLSISSPSVTEGDAGSVALTFTVSLLPASGQQVRVNYADAGTGSATSGTDYTALTPGTLTFAAGTTSATITVSVTGDTDPEPDETVVITLSGAVRAQIGTVTGTGRIADDDGRSSQGASEPTLSIDSPSVAEGDAGPVSLRYTVSLDPPASAPVTVDYAVTDAGTASAADFTAPPPGTLRFEPGDTHRTIAVTILGDEEIEAHETVVVQLSGEQNAVLGVAVGVGTILDDDGEEEEPEDPQDPRPVLVGRIAAALTYRTGSPIPPLTLPAAVGGNSPVVYSLTPDLPPGLTLALPARTVSGTPTEPQAETEYLWTATDADGDATTRTFAITVQQDRRPTFGDAVGPEVHCPVGRRMTEMELPAATGGDGPLTYSVSPALPGGIVFSTADMILRGVPFEERGRTRHLLTATDEDGDTATLGFTVSTMSVPAVDALRIVSRPENGHTYFFGEVIELEAEFSEPIAAPGSARVALTIGSAARSAWLAGHDGAVLRFRYRVREMDHDPDGLSVAANALVFREPASEAMARVPDLRHPPLPARPNQRVDGAPQATGALPPVTLTVGGEPARVEVREAFHAAVTYAAVSSAPAVAAAAMENRTVVVSAVGEGAATVTVTGRNAGGLAEQSFEVTVVTARAEREVLEHSLAGFGRGLLNSASATVGRRLQEGGGAIGGGAGPATGEGEGRGGSVQLTGVPIDDRMRLEESLTTARSFSLSATRGGKRWTLWSAGDLQSLSGASGPGSTWQGGPRTGWLGMDVSAGRVLAGLAVSRSAGDLDYLFHDAGSAVGGSGRLETRLFSVHPYFRWTVDERTRVWAHGGLGRGAATLTRSVVAGAEEADLALRVGLAGMRRELGTAGGASLALRADLAGARLRVDDGTGALRDLSATVFRGRLGVEASRRLGAAVPFVELGGRYDGGSGAVGAGLEVAGGLRVADARSRFGVEAQGRLLALHSASGYRESGFSLVARWSPSGGERGLTIEAQPTWGAPAQGARTFWNDRDLAAMRPEGPGRRGMATRVSYGLDFLTPFTEVTWTEALSHLLRAGVRVGRYGEAVHLELAGTRQERPAGAPDYRLDLYGRLRIP